MGRDGGVVRFKVAGGAAFDLRVIAADNAAIGLWVRAGSWSASHGTDGEVPDDVMSKLGTRRQIVSLAAARLIAETATGTWTLLDSGLCGFTLGERAPIPAKVRELVYSRDGFRCRECGTAQDLSLDHIHPWSKGGSDHPENLQTLCRSCNSRKGARLASEVT